MKCDGAPMETAARDRLLEASVELFTTKGYAATSVREIVTAAGVTKPVLYYYFGSKEGIYLELMHTTSVLFEKILSQIDAVRGTARERVIRFATDVFDAFVANIRVVRLIYAIFFGPPQGAPAYPHEKHFELMLEMVGKLIREGIASGEFRQVEVNAATWAIIASMNTIMEEQLCHAEPRVDRDGLVMTIALILDGITDGGRK